MALALLAASAAAGCLGGDEPPQARVVYELAVHPPDDSVGNRSDIDDFQTFDVVFDSTQLYTANTSRPMDDLPRSTFAWTDEAGEDPKVISEFSLDADRLERFTTTLTVVEALHENGSRPEVHTAPAGLYFRGYTGADQPTIENGETLRFRWHFAVTLDDEEVQNSQVPEGEYFVRTLPATGPVR